MPRLKREIILEAHIDDSKTNNRLSNEDNRIREIAERTLTDVLPSELEHLFGLKVGVEIKGVRYGSLSIFFGVVFTAYEILSGYKGIYDSVELLKQQAGELLGVHLKPYGDYRINVYTRYPVLRDPESMWRRRLKRFAPDPFDADFFFRKWVSV